MKIKLIASLIIFALASGLSMNVTAGQTDDMQDDLAMRANLLEKFNKKHERALVNAAQDEAFKKYFKAASNDEKAKLKAEIEQLSLSVQAKFKVDEMCLIDKKGQEISRIVFKEIAPDADLSPEEGSAPFFSPAFAKKARKVYVSEPYMSADSLRWVVAYVTPIVLEDGSKPGIYHFEVPLYSIQKAVNRGIDVGKDSYLLLVDKNGYIMSDSREKYKLELKGSIEDEVLLKNYFPASKDDDFGGMTSNIRKGIEGAGDFTQDGKKYAVAYKPAGYFEWAMVRVQATK